MLTCRRHASHSAAHVQLRGTDGLPAGPKTHPNASKATYKTKQKQNPLRQGSQLPLLQGRGISKRC